MLCWPCDLIVAADNAEFSDPVIRLGLGCIEYLGHPWEMGPRKAKELLFTGNALDAYEAERLGMVNRVVPVDGLRQEVLTLAREIAAHDPFALLQAKRAVNQTLDVQGFSTAVQAAFDIHGVGHGAAISRTGKPTLTDLLTMKTNVRAAPGRRKVDR
jgi:enoyl-CoA hydratase/carnithine racemase